MKKSNPPRQFGKILLNKLREFSKIQKSYALLIMIICGLLFYANGIAFNLLASPLFSGEVVAYTTTAVAVSLTIIAFMLFFVEKLKDMIPNTNNLHVINSLRTSQKNMQSDQQSTTQKDVQSNAKNKTSINNETTVKGNKEKITCPKCKKDFVTPLCKIENFNSKPNLINLCPYCNQRLDSEQKNQSTSKPDIQTNTNENAVIKQDVEAKEKKETLTCPKCKKEFSIPCTNLRYFDSKPKLIVLMCPYCEPPKNKRKRNQQSNVSLTTSESCDYPEIT